ncbi:amidohydrolase [Govanella unica]|uniref:Amidohydrolase n=1 Tax=Govanella unica TaxID=2975056 RepID=A0A9X3Z7W3_9PROT|nr:amidohydrolase [Govania unica]MDA5194419.1 amidohydrolase [Govania unica]
MSVPIAYSLALLAFGIQAASARDYADTLYLNGTVITMDDATPTASAVAVREGRIIAVGTKADTAVYGGPKTRVIDLAGKTMLPGFIDAHSHIGDYTLFWGLPDLAPPPVGDVLSIADISRVMRDFVTTHKPSADVITVGFSYDDSLLEEKRHPSLAELNRIAPGTPICLIHISGHLAACNSDALAKLGFVKGSPDPKGGRIQRDSTGEPTGILEEQAIMAILTHMAKKSPAQLQREFGEIQDYYAQQGYTTAQDGQTFAPSTFDLLLAAQRDNSLKLDIISYPKWTIIEQEAAKRGFTVGGPYVNHLKFAGVKITEDGSPQGKTAYLTKPYFHSPAGAAKDYRGSPIMPQDQLDGWYEKFFTKGWQVNIHCNGDACIDMAIAAIEKAEQAHPESRASRPVVIHSQVMRPEQLAAYKRLGIFPAWFAEHVFYWGDWHRTETLGPERAAFISPTASGLQAGLKFSLHTDAPVVPPKPLHAVWSAVNRLTRSGVVLGPEQRISVMDALRAVTIWAAYQQFDEKIKGTITPGKLADFTILGENPTTISPLRIKDIPVLMTIKEDKVIYEQK